MYPGRGFDDHTPGVPRRTRRRRRIAPGRTRRLRSLRRLCPGPASPAPPSRAAPSARRRSWRARPRPGAGACTSRGPRARAARVGPRALEGGGGAGFSLLARPPTPGGGGLYTSGALRSRRVATGAAFMSSICRRRISAAVSGSISPAAPPRPGAGPGVPRVERPMARRTPAAKGTAPLWRETPLRADDRDARARDELRRAGSGLSGASARGGRGERVAGAPCAVPLRASCAVVTTPRARTRVVVAPQHRR